MRKIITCLLAFSCLVMFTGCEEKTQLSKYDETMKDYATNYYNSFVKGTEGLTEFNITVARLKEAVELNIVNYDMNELSTCTDESYVILKINQTNNDVEDIEYHMECNK